MREDLTIHHLGRIKTEAQTITGRQRNLYSTLEEGDMQRVKIPTTVEVIIESGVIAVVRASSSSRLTQVISSLLEGGITCIEITMTTPDALAIIQELSRDKKDAIVGAGSILDGETARTAILAGAEFIVCPTLELDVIRMAKRYSKVVVPGTFTPTEILRAWEAGADIVKVFPASRLGPRYFKDIKGPLPQVRLMPTGGVNLENAEDFIVAGADAVSVGSSLLDKSAIANERYEILTRNARQFIAAVKRGREIKDAE